MSALSFRRTVAWSCRRGVLIALLIGPVWAAAPLPVSSVAQVAGGGLHTCVLTTTGAVTCLGSGYFGQIGDGGTFDRPLPTPVAGLSTDVSMIAAGGVHSCALNTSGGVRCWGNNISGQLGDGSTTDRPTSVPVMGLSSGVLAIAAGGFHTCALMQSDGSLRCWGENSSGQLGNNSTTSSASPVTVMGLPEAALAIAAGGAHTCALLMSGNVNCWGDNTFGQLGDNSGTQQNLPVAVTGLGGAANRITLGAIHSCARVGTGLQCWGANTLGQLGDTTTTDRPQPVVVSDLVAGVATMSAGGLHTCAISAGPAQCWGFNVFGQLGDGSRVDRLSPVDVLGANNEANIASGGFHGCAWTSGGVAKCWGNYDGREFAAVSALRDALSLQAATDASGRFMLFESDASDLIAAADTNAARDIFRLDRQTGERVRVSLDDGEAEILGASSQPALSADGQLAVFVAQDAAVGMLRGESTKRAAARRKGAGWAVYMRNLITGSTQRVGSATSTGLGTAPQLAPGGAAVVFTSTIVDPMIGTPGQDNVLRVPLTLVGNERIPEAPRCVTCKAVLPDGQDGSEPAAGASGNATLSEDGTWVAFETGAKNLIAGASAPCPTSGAEIMLRNMITGRSQRVAGTAMTCGPTGSVQRKPKLDWPGKRLVFESDQPLRPGDANAVADIYAVDLAQGTLDRISDDDAGNAGNAASLDPSISGDGSVVSFVSAADNLDAASGAGNGKMQVHVGSLRGGPLRRLHKTARLGDAANGDSRRPALNYNGTAFAFDSDADNIAPGAPSGQINVYARGNPDRADVVFAAGFE